MPRTIIDDDSESQPQVGYGSIVAFAVCLGLSILCGLLWVFLLLSPQMLEGFL